MKSRTLAIAFLTLVALAANGQRSNISIDFRPVSCVRGGELPVLQMNVTAAGQLRAYFRRINTTDWCSVEGVNDGPLSRIILPKFDNGDEIEYFIVLLDGKRVIARSPRIYRARVTSQCEAPFARHVERISLTCGDDGTGIPASMGAGFAMKKGKKPCVMSPDSPDDKPCKFDDDDDDDNDDQ